MGETICLEERRGIEAVCVILVIKARSLRDDQSAQLNALLNAFHHANVQKFTDMQIVMHETNQSS